MLAIACFAQLIVVAGTVIINVALPAIRSDLGYSATGLQWVVNAYVLTFAGFLLLGGRLGDLIGLRRVFLAGLGLFTLASLAGGLAQSTAWMTSARAVQGIGGAILAPASLSIITTTFAEGPARTRALGIWSAVVGAGGAIGVLAGGILTSQLSWRWVLDVNVPIGVIGLIAGRRYLPATAGDRSTHLDLPGAATITSGLGLTVYAIVETTTYAWGSTRTLATLGAAAVLLAAFVLIQRRSPQPLVPFSVFRSRAVVGANVVQLAVGAAFFAYFYFVALFLQGVLGYDALKTGVAITPIGLSIAIGAQASSRLVRRTGPRPLVIAGLIAYAAGLAWMGQISATTTYIGGIIGPGIVLSVGLGLLLTPLATVATGGVPRHLAGLASGLLNTSRQLGGSLGLAVLASLATSRIDALSTAHRLTPTAAALSNGYARAFLVAAAFPVAALLATALLPGRPARTATQLESTAQPTTSTQSTHERPRGRGGSDDAGCCLSPACV